MMAAHIILASALANLIGEEQTMTEDGIFYMLTDMLNGIKEHFQEMLSLGIKIRVTEKHALRWAEGE